MLDIASMQDCASTIAIQKILVPTDFSLCALDAVRLAVDLAKRYGAVITLVHVAKTQNRDADAALLAALHEIAGDAAHVECRLLYGDPFAEIIDLAGDGDFGLIVMGTSGYVEHSRQYSITGAIIRNAPCPVMTIRSPSPTALRYPIAAQQTASP